GARGDLGHAAGRTEILEGVEGGPVVGLGVLPLAGGVLLLERLAEPPPGGVGGVEVAAGVQGGFEVAALLLGQLLVGRLGGLALAPAGVGVVPLEYEMGAVGEALHPDLDALGHGFLR